MNEELQQDNIEESKSSYTKYLKILIICIVISVFGVAAYLTLHLEIFTVQEIVISGNSEIKDKEILKRSGLRQGESSIFFFENSIQQSILKNPWVKSVLVTKEFPKKVNIDIQEEQPYCLVVGEGARMYYLNKDGKRLGSANFKQGLDFPVLIGEGINDAELVQEAIQLLELSSKSKVLGWSQISEVYLDSIYGISLFTIDKKIIEFDTKNIVGKWHRVEKIITHAEMMGIEEKYINISSDNMGVVDFNLPVVQTDVEKDG